MINHVHLISSYPLLNLVRVFGGIKQTPQDVAITEMNA